HPVRAHLKGRESGWRSRNDFRAGHRTIPSSDPLQDLPGSARHALLPPEADRPSHGRAEHKPPVSPESGPASHSEAIGWKAQADRQVLQAKRMSEAPYRRN